MKHGPPRPPLEWPDDFLALGDTFKYEVLARDESFNQTATESSFKLR